MTEYFQCGSVDIPQGVTELSVSTALVFTPENVTVSVRQPAASAPLVNAYVTGGLAATGFSVAFSSAPESAGYVLDWIASSNAANPSVAGDTLAVSYGDLKKSVAHYLGWDPSNLSEYQSGVVDSCIQSGVRRFYYPPQMEGVDPNFEWSFLRQNGALSVTAGTDSYQLPNGFGRIAGQLVVRGEPAPSIPVIPFGDLSRMRQTGHTGRPRFAAVAAEQSFGTRGQMKRLYLFPKPDADIVLDFVCDADTGKLDPVSRPFPLGGAMFAELVTEACLAAAENNVNDTREIHSDNFNQLLVSMIARDRKSSAQVFGPVGDKPHRRGPLNLLERHELLVYPTHI